MVTMVPSGMTVRSTSTFLVGVREDRIGKALWELDSSSVSTYSSWQKENKQVTDLCCNKMSKGVQNFIKNKLFTSRTLMSLVSEGFEQ